MGIEVGGLALNARDPSLRDPHTASCQQDFTLALRHHHPDQSRLDPQLVQGFHFVGIKVGGLAPDAPDPPMHLPWPSRLVLVWRMERVAVAVQRHSLPAWRLQPLSLPLGAQPNKRGLPRYRHRHQSLAVAR